MRCRNVEGGMGMTGIGDRNAEMKSKGQMPKGLGHGIRKAQSLKLMAKRIKNEKRNKLEGLRIMD